MIADWRRRHGPAIWMIASALLFVAWSGCGKAQDATPPAAVGASTESASGQDTAGGGPVREIDAGDLVTRRIDALRQHFVDLGNAVPRVPDELRQAAGTLRAELTQTGVIRVLLLIGALLVPAIGAELLCRHFMARWHPSPNARRSPRLYDRVRSVASTLAIALAPVIVFTLVVAIVFLIFDWPVMLRRLIVGYLIAAIALRVALAIGRSLLAPQLGDDQAALDRRLLPLDRKSALYWHHRIAWLVGWFAFGWMTVELLNRLGVSTEVRRLVAFTLALGLLAIAIEVAWRRPHPDLSKSPQHASGSAAAGLWSLYFIALWAFFVAGMFRMFWLAAVLAAVPVAIRISRRAMEHLAAPAPGEPLSQGLSISTACLVRGVRALLIVAGVFVLAYGWRIDFAALAEANTVPVRLLRGAVSAVVLALLGDFIWHVVRSAIDAKLDDARAVKEGLDAEELRRKARLRTLLPILRNVLMIVFLLVVALMALAALGVEIAPLIAGAGVMGVAVGFGAQTLVKDIISGMFYLLDDAFRVGEYIQSGDYKGTVESFSLRSVKLRHHRGPLYTVPFGELGAVQNMSRDWVIDKLRVAVTYDADLDQARKIIKQIGRSLQQDAEMGPNIIQPLKMQGVEELGPSGIEIRMKMMTKPGEQFVVRRRAYAEIKKAFHQAGIRFAVPTVQVSGDADDNAGVAAQSIAQQAQYASPA
jgi:small-conductance mechanosensitive channel